MQMSLVTDLHISQTSPRNGLLKAVIDEFPFYLIMQHCIRPLIACVMAGSASRVLGTTVHRGLFTWKCWGAEEPVWGRHCSHWQCNIRTYNPLQIRHCALCTKWPSNYTKNYGLEWVVAVVYIVMQALQMSGELSILCVLVHCLSKLLVCTLQACSCWFVHHLCGAEKVQLRWSSKRYDMEPLSQHYPDAQNV